MLLLLIGQIIVLINLSFVDSITPRNPCDPLRSNVSVKDVLNSNMLEIIKELQINSFWFVQPMNYINCSRRGLDKISPTVPSNVQMLDLSTNKISQVRKEDLEKFKDLQVLWLHSNRLRSLPCGNINCENSSLPDEFSFGSLTSLKVLSIADNAFTTVPCRLPATLEYLDISKNEITKILINDLSHLTSLKMFNAANLCSSSICKDSLYIDYKTFENISLKILLLSENRNVFYILHDLNFQSLLYLNFAQMHGLILGPDQLKHMISVKRLDFYLQNPNSETKLQVLYETFDKLTSLEYLDLSSNRIEYLPNNIFQYNHNLTYLDLSGNCLYPSIIDPIYVPRQIKYLHLGYNYCGDINKAKFNIKRTRSLFGPSFSKLYQLRILSYAKPRNLGATAEKFGVLEFYEISHKSLFNLLQLKSLAKLIIIENYVNKVDLSTVGCLTRLDFLDLSNNLIGNVSASQLPCIHQQSKQKKAKCFGDMKLILPYNKIGAELVKHNFIHSKATWLDLKFNLISSIKEEAFKNMPCLTHIDLRNNPILFIHTYSFKKLLYLNTLYIKSTSLFPNDERSFRFLRHTILTNISQLFYLSLLNDNLFQGLRNEVKNATIAKAISNVDLSDNQIPSAGHIQKVLKLFPNAEYLVLKQCSIKFSNFFLPTKLLTYLDLSQNQIQKIMPKFLRSVLSLKTLILSHNKITHIEMNSLDILSNLEFLDLSHNHISVISSNETTKRQLKHLRTLKLQYNYISVLSEEVFFFSFLLQLHHLDLRWNSIECHCELTKSFGLWLSQGSYSLNDRPGLIPQCFSLQRFGDCVTCIATEQNKNANKQPLVQFATTSLCSNSFNRLLTAVFTSFFVLFTSVSSFLSSSKGMLWLAKFSTRRVRAINNEDEEQNLPAIFALHGFVLFDTEDIITGNWVDDQLVPELNKISPDMKIAVAGRDDQCGFTPVTQQLLKIEASRKVIVVLTGNYWQSSQGKYVLSAIEDLHYQTGHDRAVIVTFENELQVGRLLRRRKKNSPWSVLKYPADERDSPIFWESLRNSLTL